MQYSTEFCHTRHCDRLRKELDNITTKNCPEQENTEQLICCVPEGTEPQDCTEEKTTFTLTEFKELVHSAQLVISETYRPFEFYLTAAALYYILNLVLEAILRGIERKVELSR